MGMAIACGAFFYGGVPGAIIGLTIGLVRKGRTKAKIGRPVEPDRVGLFLFSGGLIGTVIGFIVFSVWFSVSMH
ncbi:MAG: hypothetical protein ACI87E_000118 [Mariniblastus sp.]|jgi:hypothetical protein